jgi:hypothetical protein
MPVFWIAGIGSYEAAEKGYKEITVVAAFPRAYVY